MTAAAGEFPGPSFYVGKISVGQPPQELRVLFDTSSGHVLLPHRGCKSPACHVHRRYSPWQSSTAMDVNFNGTEVLKGSRFAKDQTRRDVLTVVFTQTDLGEGQADAVGVRDHVCLGGGDGRKACVDLAVLAATKMEDVPFRAMPHDGIVGLGLEGLSVDPLSNLLGRLAESSEGMLPQFGVSFGAESGSLFIGGHDPTRLAAPIQWVPVDHPEDGYWQVAIQAVRVGDATVDDCRDGCHGVVDTGSSGLGVQASNLPKLQRALASSPVAGQGCQGPDLTFDLGGVSLMFRAEDYAGAGCKPQLGSLNLTEPVFKGVYSFGATVLRPYYVAFDWKTHHVGFAPVARRPVGGGGEPLLAPLAGQIVV